MTARGLLIHRCFSCLPIFLGTVKYEIDIRNLCDLNLVKFELILVSHYLCLFI
jgi:hypothetical protein